MSYIYGKRATCHDTDLTRALRQELYPVPYDSIDWYGARNKVATEDLYYPHPWIQPQSRTGLHLTDAALGRGVRGVHVNLAHCLCGRVVVGALQGGAAAAGQQAAPRSAGGDENTRYIDIGPVNKAINMLACWVEDPNSTAFK
ncbi:terpene cyclase/mutase family member, partial [Haematococcus lacustris]